ncbi:MAG TPA: membrane bound O-acyl transferase family-domain-containing protein, partial [Abditibacteriaceae bacterium]|nr:membrane bound O-acyl transferase family-domain-containing protein [Abditibacteriaceae bacterium]
FQLAAFFVGLLAFWTFALATVFMASSRALRKTIGWVMPLLALGVMLAFGAQLQPWQRLLASTLALLYLLKATILLQKPRSEIIEYSKFGLLLYFSVWPGMNPQPFRARAGVEAATLKTSERLFVRGMVVAVCGVATFVLTSIFAAHIPRELLGWLGIAAFLMTLHFGFSDVLTFALRWIGFPVGKLFDAPFMSVSLRDFWSRRWNLAFVEMDNLLFFKPFRRKLGASGAILGVFAVSGILHEMALSFVAGAGWGGPMCYFLLHGFLILFENKLRTEKRWPIGLSRLWTWLWILAPLPILFHAPFRDALLTPLIEYSNRLLTSRPIDWWFSLALWMAALGHFCILGASFQVPSRLRWKEDLAKLTPFNRKIMWTYGGVIVMLIVSFGTMTLALHHEMLRGDRAALMLAGLIGLFWLVRILVDFFYFNHSDWPQGAEFVVGHVFLTGLFIALTSVYFGLIIRHNFF